MSAQPERALPERLIDAEASGAIGERMRRIMEREGRKPPEHSDALPTAISVLAS